jgi:hypothetical protein
MAAGEDQPQAVVFDVLVLPDAASSALGVEPLASPPSDASNRRAAASRRSP